MRQIALHLGQAPQDVGKIAQGLGIIAQRVGKAAQGLGKVPQRVGKIAQGLGKVAQRFGHPSYPPTWIIGALQKSWREKGGHTRNHPRVCPVFVLNFEPSLCESV